jgi:hypothetical protein
MKRVDVGGLSFHAHKSRAVRTGFFIGPDGFDGWDDGVDVRRDEILRAGAHGSFSAAGFRAARTVTLKGTCISQSAVETRSLGRRLTGLLAAGGPGRVQVDYGDGDVLFAEGFLTATPQFAVRGYDQTLADWQLQLWFPNPRKYGKLTDLRVTGPGEAQPIYHRGNFLAAPKMIVRGSMSGYRIEGPGSTYVVGRPVIDSAPHVIDNATGLLTIGGIVQFGAITSGTGWVIAPGTQPVTHKLVPLSGTGTLETRIRDTYI